jgi:hypothetical protein
MNSKVLKKKSNTLNKMNSKVLKKKLNTLNKMKINTFPVEESLRFIENIVIPFNDNIKLGKKIGRGNFGTVYEMLPYTSGFHKNENIPKDLNNIVTSYTKPVNTVVKQIPSNTPYDISTMCFNLEESAKLEIAITEYLGNLDIGPTVYDYWRDKNYYYFEMDRMTGRVDDVLENEELDLIEQKLLLEELKKKMNASNIINRDLSYDHFYYKLIDDKPHYYFIDFGIAYYTSIKHFLKNNGDTISKYTRNGNNCETDAP